MKPVRPLGMPQSIPSPWPIVLAVALELAFFVGGAVWCTWMLVTAWGCR